MAVIPGAAIDLSAPGTYHVPYPGGGTNPQGGHQWTQLKLENASPFSLTVLLGGTPVYSIPAGVADVMPLTYGPSGPGPTSAAVDAAPAQLISVMVTGGTVPTGLSGTLRPSFGQYGDMFPGTYPLSLSPWGVATISDFDPYGAFTSVQTSVSSGTLSVILANPPAGQLWRIRRIAISAPTTAVSVANNVYIVGNISGGGVISSYATAGGIDYQESMDLVIAEGLNCHNNLTVATNCTVWYRAEPVPSYWPS